MQEHVDIGALSNEALLFTRDTAAAHTKLVLDEALASVHEDDLSGVTASQLLQAGPLDKQ